MELTVSFFSTDTETDRLQIKLKQFKAIRQAAYDLMQQKFGLQAVETYVEISGLIHEIELELVARQQFPSSCDN